MVMTDEAELWASSRQFTNDQIYWDNHNDSDTDSHTDWVNNYDK